MSLVPDEGTSEICRIKIECACRKEWCQGNYRKYQQMQIEVCTGVFRVLLNILYLLEVSQLFLDHH